MLCRSRAVAVQQLPALYGHKETRMIDEAASTETPLFIGDRADLRSLTLGGDAGPNSQTTSWNNTMVRANTMIPPRTMTGMCMCTVHMALSVCVNRRDTCPCLH